MCGPLGMIVGKTHLCLYVHPKVWAACIPKETENSPNFPLHVRSVRLINANNAAQQLKQSPCVCVVLASITHGQ